MKKLNLLAVSVGAALVCTAVPSSFNWSPANGALFSLDTAEARVGRPLTPVSVAGVNRRVDRRVYRRAAADCGWSCCGWSCRCWSCRCGGAAGAAYVGGPAPAPGPDLGRRQSLMASQAMATAQGPTGHCDREPCHRKVVQDRTDRLSMVLDAIAGQRRNDGKRSGVSLLAQPCMLG